MTGRKEGLILTTAGQVEGYEAVSYLGIVSGSAVTGANVFKDILASITDVIGGRSRSYETEIRKARGMAEQDLAKEAERRGADAVIGLSVDTEIIDSGGGSMMMVSFTGTAVQLVSRS